MKKATVIFFFLFFILNCNSVLSQSCEILGDEASVTWTTQSITGNVIRITFKNHSQKQNVQVSYRLRGTENVKSLLSGNLVIAANATKSIDVYPINKDYPAIIRNLQVDARKCD